MCYKNRKYFLYIKSIVLYEIVLKISLKEGYLKFIT